MLPVVYAIGTRLAWRAAIGIALYIGYAVVSRIWDRFQQSQSSASRQSSWQTPLPNLETLSWLELLELYRTEVRSQSPNRETITKIEEAFRTRFPERLPRAQLACRTTISKPKEVPFNDRKIPCRTICFDLNSHNNLPPLTEADFDKITSHLQICVTHHKAQTAAPLLFEIQLRITAPNTLADLVANFCVATNWFVETYGTEIRWNSEERNLHRQPVHDAASFVKENPAEKATLDLQTTHPDIFQTDTAKNF